MSTECCETATWETVLEMEGYLVVPYFVNIRSECKWSETYSVAECGFVTRRLHYLVSWLQLYVFNLGYSCGECGRGMLRVSNKPPSAVSSRRHCLASVLNVTKPQGRFGCESRVHVMYRGVSPL